MLDRAVSLNKKSEQAHYWRGMLNKRLGKNEAALKDFKFVTELYPRNIDAAREVRLYQMRGGPRNSARPPRSRGPPRASGAPQKADTPKPGLLNRLFKKP